MYDPTLYTLTHIIRRSSESRRVVIQGLEVRYRTAAIVLGGIVVSMPLALIGWLIVGTYSLVVIPLVIAGLWAVFEWKSRTGLRLPMYRTLLDRRLALTGAYHICSIPYDPSARSLVTISAAVVAVAELDDGEPDERADLDASIDAALGVKG